MTDLKEATLEWESLACPGLRPPGSGNLGIGPQLFRARVPGGWLVREVTGGDGNDRGDRTSIVYVPDPDGEWK